MSDDAEATKLIERAKLAEQAERFEDMAGFMKKAVDLKAASSKPLNTEERNLLSVAYKNIVGSKRSAWRVISSIAEKDESRKKETEKYLAIIEKELTETCTNILELIGDKLIRCADDSDYEAKVFFFKMQGDYYRYITEVKTKEARQEYVDKAREAYEQAKTNAESSLVATNPIRLGLALNMSVFHYEIANDSGKACDLAKKAFDDAIQELDSLADQDSYKDATLILQLLRDNLTLWNSEQIEDQEQLEQEQD